VSVNAVQQDETPEELPEGWTGCRLGDIADLVSGAGFPLEKQGRKGLQYRMMLPKAAR
jgi:hypothetical protein